MRYAVEVATTYYDVEEVDAENEGEARARVRAGLGQLQGGTYSDAEIGEVRPALHRLDGCA